ncbi:MAG TPA: NAD(P)H-hydrate epimerase [Tepidisphaeraceae bacterium]|jgi:NAD(P)H-hydrate epimerase|nr:NAD(P)H-hydrate epimerase [Tepidisphaeraceae bacterium]
MLALARQQVREVDRIAIEKYHIPGIVLMENAARGATDVALEMLGQGANQNILILCGGGNNGGDGLAISRHLHNHGHNIRIALCTDPAKYQGDALINWRIVEAMNLPRLLWENAFDQMPSPDLIIDAIFGTGLTETARPPFTQILDRVTATRRSILAIDIPSGLDCDTGRPLGPCIRATRTVTFFAPKIGFENPESKQFTGPVTVADIGCPREAIDEAMKLHP